MFALERDSRPQARPFLYSAAMRVTPASGRPVLFAFAAIVATVVAACSGGTPPDTERTGGDAGAAASQSAAESTTPTPARPSYIGAPADTSHSIVQRAPTVNISRAFTSRPLRELANAAEDEGEKEEGGVHAPLPLPLAPGVLSPLLAPDAVLQSGAPIRQMPVALRNFLGQGTTLEGCVFPSPPAGCTTTGDPADTNGAVGPNHFVQVVNGGIGIWNKAGTVVMTPKKNNLLWAGYPTTSGNACAASNNGDPVVVYDQIADRWLVTQFDIHNFIANTGTTNYQCVAVSKTADPTGAYSLYDFPYAGLNDYGKFGLWPDAYLATFNLFNSAGTAFLGSDICAYDRVSMLAGATATQQCFQQGAGVGGVLPVSMDGKVLPPRGEPGFFANFGAAVANIWKMHVDWVTPANSTLTGPTSLGVAPFTITCSGISRQACVPQPGTAQQVSALSDRAMFRLAYRNFGTHESLTFNHAIAAGGTSGIRWYELRAPNGTPTVFQQGTYAPADGNWRWLGSMAMDQAEDFALGFSISNGTTLKPSIAWTGRLNGDAVGTMGQGETTIDTGGGVETGANRWGDYSNMTVDPADDCTFWYTSQLFNTTGTFTWDTNIASVKFPSCGANDFSIAVAPPTQSVQENRSVTYTVTTTSTAGAAESIALVVQDLPTGVTGSFSPATVTAGGTSTLTVSATIAAPIVPLTTFTVIGKAPSAVHAANAQVAVIACAPGTTCPAGQNCGTAPNGCGGTLSCGTCTAPQTCGGGGTPNQCGCTPITTCGAGQNCGTIPNGCGGTVNCGTCTAPNTCGGGGAPNQCGCTPVTTCPAGTNCGTIPNGCGGTVTCGPACTAPQTCGGGGTANICGCTPLTTCPGGQNCGTAANGCGGTLSCGTCTAPQTCGGGGTPTQCGCTPATTCPAGQACGTAPDNCGGNVNCGTCAAPQTCGGGGTANQCGCTKTTCAAEGAQCDSISDKCGGTLACGSCASDSTCVANKCVAPGTDAGGSTDSGSSGGTDSGSRADAAQPGGDGGGSNADGGGGGGTGSDGGCGCRTVDAKRTPSWALTGVGGLALLGALRRRRRTSKRDVKATRV